MRRNCATAEQGLQTINNPLTFIDQFHSVGNLSLSPMEESHSDTTLCGVDPTIYLGFEEQTEIIDLVVNFNNTAIKNITNEPLQITCHNLQGQEVASFHLDAFQQRELTALPSGIILFCAEQNNKFQHGKIRIPQDYCFSLLRTTRCTPSTCSNFLIN